MRITVADLKKYLDEYPDESFVRFGINAQDYGFIVEHHGSIVIHPYEPRTAHRTDL